MVFPVAVLPFLITPLLAWVVAGSVKFVINSLRLKAWAFQQIGNGGMPSSHSAVVASTAVLIFLYGDWGPALGVAVTLAFIVILDANGLRKHVERQARAINSLTGEQSNKLRERIGHSKLEIAAGIGVGACVATLVYYVLGGRFS